MSRIFVWAHEMLHGFGIAGLGYLAGLSKFEVVGAVDNSAPYPIGADIALLDEIMKARKETTKSHTCYRPNFVVNPFMQFVKGSSNKSIWDLTLEKNQATKQLVGGLFSQQLYCNSAMLINFFNDPEKVEEEAKNTSFCPLHGASLKMSGFSHFPINIGALRIMDTNTRPGKYANLKDHMKFEEPDSLSMLKAIRYDVVKFAVESSVCDVGSNVLTNKRKYESISSLPPKVGSTTVTTSRENTPSIPSAKRPKPAF